MRVQTFSCILLLFLVFPRVTGFIQLAEAGKRSTYVPDDLDDVVDDEEDEDWKEWGRGTPKFDPPPDFSNMNLEQIQEEMAKRTFGPVFGFIKLRRGVPRTREAVAEIAMRWTKVLRTGAIGINFMGIDLSTIMFNMEKGQAVMELKEYVLSQPEAYEIKIGDQVYRRPEDPPIEQANEQFEAHKKEAADGEATAGVDHGKDEL